MVKFDFDACKATDTRLVLVYHSVGWGSIRQVCYAEDIDCCYSLLQDLIQKPHGKGRKLASKSCDRHCQSFSLIVWSITDVIVQLSVDTIWAAEPQMRCNYGHNINEEQNACQMRFADESKIAACPPYRALERSQSLRNIWGCLKNVRLHRVVGDTSISVSISRSHWGIARQFHNSNSYRSSILGLTLALKGLLDTLPHEETLAKYGVG